MTQIRNNKHAKEACVASDKDPFETLPEDVLQYLLSFLPSRDVVRTCVLACRWRTLWKAVPSLLINTDDEKEETYKSAYALNKFVHNLFLSRERVPLYVCKITSYGADDTDPDEALKYIESWLRYAVSCQVQELGIYIRQQELILPLCDVPLVSTHLTRLDLKFVEFWGCSLDFSTCPALKVLKAEDCTLEVERISSQSLTHLIINGGSFLVINGRTRISVPSLIVLELTNYEGYTPVLDCTPSLVRAFLRFGCLDGYCDDCYENGNYLENCRSRAGSCYGSNDCVLLEALSGATNLELISPPELFICRMDFDKCNHMFSNLKTLSLGEWGVADDFSALIYFVMQSPILERITLQLGYKLLKDKLRFDEEPMDETAKSYIPLEQFVVSKHLKVVKIKCHKEDERIHQIVKIISTLGVLPEHIYIERTAYTSELERQVSVLSSAMKISVLSSRSRLASLLFPGCLFALYATEFCTIRFAALCVPRLNHVHVAGPFPF